MAQSAGKSRSKSTRSSDSVLGEGELSAQRAYLLGYFFFYSNQVMLNYDLHLL